jgi:GxxExxY protein
MFHDMAGHEQLTQDIIGCAIRVHEAFGPGLFESIYKQCLVIELKGSGFAVDTARRIPLTYRGHDIDAHFCPDIIVENTVIVELKAVDALARVHKTQVITYLKLTGCPAGLIMNFNSTTLKAGLKRLDHPERYRKRTS